MMKSLGWRRIVSSTGKRATLPSRSTSLKSGVSSMRNLMKMPITTSAELAMKGMRQPHAVNCSSLRSPRTMNDTVPSAMPSGKPICTMLP